MKKTILLLVVALISLPVISQDKKYTKSMLKAIESRDAASDQVRALECVGSFEDLSAKYADQWLPSYYAADILITNSFEERDLARCDELLDWALKNLHKAEKLAPEESEIAVMKAMYYIAMMASDPETRGPMYYQDAGMTIDMAKKLNPDNPRAAYLDAMMTLNMPDFMGGGPEAAKPLFLKAQEKFKNYKNDDPLWPSWGEDLVEEELSN